MRYRLPNRSGFTFIELLVTVTIMGMLLALVLANFGDFNKSRRLSEAADDFVANLRMVGTKAFSGDKPAICIEDLQGYRVTIPAGIGSQYSIAVDCPPAVPPAVNYSLLNGVNFSSHPADIVFTFLPLDEGVELPGAVDELELNLQLDTLSTIVKVTRLGGIYVD